MAEGYSRSVVLEVREDLRPALRVALLHARDHVRGVRARVVRVLRRQLRDAPEPRILAAMRKYPHTTAEPEGRGGKGTRTLAMLMLGPKPVRPTLSLGSPRCLPTAGSASRSSLGPTQRNAAQ